MRPRLLAVVGPTGTGKSAFAARAGLEFDGEVVNADSRLFYRGFDIGTAKPTVSERRGVPHHLIDILDANERYGLGGFVRVAREKIAEVSARGRLPVLVGGTGQYVWALLEGWEVPDVQPDLALRVELERVVEQEGVGALYERLRRANPASAASVDPLNPRRVVRAMERAIKGTGGPTMGKAVAPPFDGLVIGFTLRRPALYGRIDARIDQMVEGGWVDEVKALLQAGADPASPAMSSIGYHDLVRHVRGEISLDEAVMLTRRATRRLIRHQYNWFKLADARIRWFDAEAGVDGAMNCVGEWLEDDVLFGQATGLAGHV